MTSSSPLAQSRRRFLLAAASFAAVAAGPWPAAAAATPPERRLFGKAEIRIAGCGSVPAWTAMLDRHAAQNDDDYASCPERLRFLASSCGNRRWADLVAQTPPRAGRDLLAWVNERLNREPAMADSALWNAADHWATPREFLALGGDCEDYAIAKFHLLRRFGWPAGDLRLVVVRGGRPDVLHAVLAAREGESTYILDNLCRELRRDAECLDSQPVYAVCESGLHLYR